MDNSDMAYVIIAIGIMLITAIVITWKVIFKRD